MQYSEIFFNFNSKYYMCQCEREGLKNFNKDTTYSVSVGMTELELGYIKKLVEKLTTIILCK
jgi:hypothetical protein